MDIPLCVHHQEKNTGAFADWTRDVLWHAARAADEAA
jgi:hypothetical protein